MKKNATYEETLLTGAEHRVARLSAELNLAKRQLNKLSNSFSGTSSAPCVRALTFAFDKPLSELRLVLAPEDNALIVGILHANDVHGKMRITNCDEDEAPASTDGE